MLRLRRITPASLLVLVVTAAMTAAATTSAVAKPPPGPPPPCSRPVDIPGTGPTFATASVCIEYTRAIQNAQGLFELASFVPEDDNDSGLDDCAEGDPFCACTAQVSIQNLTRGTIDKYLFDCEHEINDAGVHHANNVLGVHAQNGDHAVAVGHIDGHLRNGQRFASSFSTPVWVVNSTF